MLARKGPSKKKILLLGGTMAVVWLIIGVVVYRTFLAKPAPAPESPIVSLPVSQPNQPVVTPVTPSQVNFEILRDPKLTNLKVYGEVPVEVKALGRPNPFLLINP